jgi:hypothetical protein
MSAFYVKKVFVINKTTTNIRQQSSMKDLYKFFNSKCESDKENDTDNNINNDSNNSNCNSCNNNGNSD